MEIKISGTLVQGVSILKLWMAPVLDAKPKERTTARIAPLLALLTGFALRLCLGRESLWYDRRDGLASIAPPAHPRHDRAHGRRHPPARLLPAPASLAAAHGAHAAARVGIFYALPSVIAGMVVLALLYAIGCRLFNPKVARSSP